MVIGRSWRRMGNTGSDRGAFTAVSSVRGLAATRSSGRLRSSSAVSALAASSCAFSASSCVLHCVRRASNQVGPAGSRHGRTRIPPVSARSPHEEDLLAPNFFARSRRCAHPPIVLDTGITQARSAVTADYARAIRPDSCSAERQRNLYPQLDQRLETPDNDRTTGPRWDQLCVVPGRRRPTPWLRQCVTGSPNVTIA